MGHVQLLTGACVLVVVAACHSVPASDTSVETLLSSATTPTTDDVVADQPESDVSDTTFPDSTAREDAERDEALTATTVAMDVDAAEAEGLLVSPFGVSSSSSTVNVAQRDITRHVASGPGDVASSYALDLGFFPQDGRLEPALTTSDGQLALDVECEPSDCSIEQANDTFQLTLQVTAHTTDTVLTEGVHVAEFTIRHDDGTSSDLDVELYAQRPPSVDVADSVADATGDPQPVQKVFGVGNFAYHAISAFDSIWIAGVTSRTVSRIDATTGELIATIPLEGEARVSRLAASSDAIYATATPVVKIDPVTNTVTRIDGGIIASGVIAHDDTVWAAGRDGIQRIDPDLTITNLAVPQAFWFDLAYGNNTVWAVSQQPDRSTLLGIDATTGEVRHDLTLPVANQEYAVRIVAVDDQIIIGTDTSGGGGRILVVDATTADIIGDVSLDWRPEGIAVTGRYIWTSGAIIDRNDLSVDTGSDYYGFAITQGPDGSIWGTGGIAGAIDAESVATRWAPGHYTGWR